MDRFCSVCPPPPTFNDLSSEGGGGEELMDVANFPLGHHFFLYRVESQQKIGQENHSREASWASRVKEGSAHA